VKVANPGRRGQHRFSGILEGSIALLGLA